MDNREKLERVNTVLVKLDYLTDKFIKNKIYNKALKNISISASIQYAINQKYTDYSLEKKISKISHELLKPQGGYKCNPGTILFYDGFGLDLRGVAINYTRAIAESADLLVYVIPSGCKERIPHICNILSRFNVAIIELEGSNYVSKVKNLNNIFSNFKPEKAFFYSGPEDVVGAVVFNSYRDMVTRYHIDLVDHAFWLGIGACDYVIVSREMGASIAVHERGFEKKQIKRLDSYVYICEDDCSIPLPFDIKNEKYFFTGGALYKTLGDKDLLFYKTVEYILDKYNELKFLYAGFGDSSEIKKMMSKFPNRVYLIPERPDFYNIIQNSLFYLNSFPMFGGMMMRYAAAAGKLPITLKHDCDSDGILINQANLGIEFTDYGKFLSEIDRIITDDEYRKRKEHIVENSVLDEKTFCLNINKLLADNITDFSFKDIVRFDTSRFRNEYIERFAFPKDLLKLLCTKDTLYLTKHFPLMFLKKYILRGGRIE